MLLVAVAFVLAAAIALTALAALTTDPRLALAITLTFGAVVSRDAAHPATVATPIVLILAATPALLALTAVRARTLRREGTQRL
jgi:hypothetical protein